MFRKVLVANRGECARRIIRTCQRLDIATVAVYSEADASAPHVRDADEAYLVGPAPVPQSYLDHSAVLDAVRRSGADAVHPGWGLLSENPEFAEGVHGVGACFIGPSPELLRAFGDKLSARRLAEKAGLALPPGTGHAASVDEETALWSEAEAIGYPLMVKAAAGGGGIGMARVEDPGALLAAVQACTARAQGAFGDATVYFEKYLDRPRHIELQLVADGAGCVRILGERECSVQRRHQKIVEEGPSPAAHIDHSDLAAWRQKSVVLFESCGFAGAGTVEFIVEPSGEMYFLEVNPRLQVEHAVTEMCTGIDIVEEQLRVAAGAGLSPQAESPKSEGHAIEARIYAEDPARKFLPQPGTLRRLVWPERSADLRIESGVVEGDVVTPYYDPMIAKLIAVGVDRTAAIKRLDCALSELSIELVGPKGPKATNVSFLRTVLGSSAFVSADYATDLVASLG